MFANFERYIDKHGECKFILAGESGKFNEERISGYLPMSYHSWYGRGLLLISSSRYSRTRLLK